MYILQSFRRRDASQKRSISPSTILNFISANMNGQSKACCSRPPVKLSGGYNYNPRGTYTEFNGMRTCKKNPHNDTSTPVNVESTPRLTHLQTFLDLTLQSEASSSAMTSLDCTFNPSEEQISSRTTLHHSPTTPENSRSSCRCSSETILQT
jgi:hypothetical protein